MHPRRYETLLLMDPDIPQDDRDTVIGKINQIIEDMNGRVIRTEDWGRRRVAYPVMKKMNGHYFLVDFMGQPELLMEVERNLRIDEFVYKYLTELLDKDFSEEKYTMEIERLKSESAKREAERAEREAAAARAAEEAAAEAEGPSPAQATPAAEVEQAPEAAPAEAEKAPEAAPAEAEKAPEAAPAEAEKAPEAAPAEAEKASEAAPAEAEKRPDEEPA